MTADRYEIAPGVLRNSLGITNREELAAVERAVAFQRSLELEANPIPGSFDFAHLRAIHRHLLHDIYPWAGNLRTSDTSAMGVAHCRAEFIPTELDRVFASIATRSLTTRSRIPSIELACEHWSELTLIHPFRDGNSRSQRIFIDQLLGHQGWAINWSDVDADAVHAARHMGLYGRYDYLIEQIEPHVFPADRLPHTGLTSTLGARSETAPGRILEQMRAHMRSGTTASFRNR